MDIQQKNEHIDISNARLDEQKAVMQNIMDAGHCPFCKENLAKYHTEEILKEGTYWLLTYNRWPYEHTRVHLLLIYKEHVTDLAGLDPQSGEELLAFTQWAQQEFGVAGGGLAMRFGDTRYSAGTVAHIHAQFICPDLDDPTYEPVRIKIGSSPKTTQSLESTPHQRS